MLTALCNNRIQVAAVMLFAVGFTTLLVHKNLLKKIIGLNIMDTAANLFLASIGYIRGRTAPILPEQGIVDASRYVNPLPAGLVLTSIVVSVATTAVMLTFSIRLYRRYHTLNIDEIYAITEKEQEEEP